MTPESHIDGLLGPLVGGRAFPDVAPQGAPVPYITYQAVGGDPINFLTGEAPDKSNTRMQVNVWAATRLEAAELGALIEATVRAATQLQPEVGRTLYQAWRNVALNKPTLAEVLVLRLQAPLFGHNAQKRTQVLQNGTVQVLGNWPVVTGAATTGSTFMHEESGAVHLDAAYPKIVANSWIVVSTPQSRLTQAKTQFFLAGETRTTITRAE